ncbi:peptidoglycan D,D-transpeptidase FtsI family protein [Nocardioides daphniae]|uniref:Penicillin-binding protein n=2 Tax=Nocardioides daphniae TaxID=402297 RepID=A0ABQ1Q3S5_9ACTN|nr:penicillin-binding protein 2 [Nocardioides daphniae]GGD11332.1 penicillin-binding protein [Nocardioides daphniae]
MNKPIRMISIFCLGLFLLLLVNVTWLQVFKADSLAENGNNHRVIADNFSRERGAILVGRQPVAQSVPTDDQYEFQREYPRPKLYAHLTGRFNWFGTTALERTQNDLLSGQDSRLFVNRVIDMLSNRAPKGGNVQLTINQAAQQAAYDGLAALPGNVEGAVVAIEPATGKILASVSLPTYDPNKLASHRFGEIIKEQERLEADDAEPLINRATGMRLPPGSTFKLVTAAAAIESEKYNADSMVPGGDSYQLPLTRGESGRIDNEGRSCGDKKVSFRQAMQNSCNTTFAALAVEVGADEMQERAERFGFNQEYLSDVPQAVSVFPKEMDAAQTGQSGLGQFEVAATPLQMAMVAGGIAHGGKVMKPYLVDELRTPQLQVLDTTDPEQLSRAVSARTARELTDLLVATVDNGTASPAAIPGVKVAGKTGTAQSGIDDVPPYAWFVSFAPANDPEVAVAVMIQSADIPRGEVAGGRLGGPIAKAVMEAVISR